MAVPSKRPCGVEGEPGQAAAPKPRPPRPPRPATAGATARSTSGGSGATGPTHPTLAAATVGGKAVVVEVRAPLQLAALVDPALQREALTVPVVSPAVVFQAALKVADQRVGPGGTGTETWAHGCGEWQGVAWNKGQGHSQGPCQGKGAGGDAWNAHFAYWSKGAGGAWDVNGAAGRANGGWAHVCSSVCTCIIKH